ncbi:MAG: hypothetical protein Kapaf2KO_09190 [Candidatus Kapaibacteriales bacterium]
MKKLRIKFSIILLISILVYSCNENKIKIEKSEKELSIDLTYARDSLIKLCPEEEFRIDKGLSQVKSLWQKSDGTEKELQDFILTNFLPTGEKLDRVFLELNESMETVYGHFNKMSVKLKMPVHVDMGEIGLFEGMMADWEPSSHFQDDMYKSKTAFLIALNFPSYSYSEKNSLGKNWTDKEWAYALAGDLFTSRIGNEYTSEVSLAQNLADKYITSYYINMGNVSDSTGNYSFPENLKLISHWNLRDEIKSLYTGKIEDFEKQKTVYQVMIRIIDQTIPKDVINNDSIKWNPFSNSTTLNGKEVESLFEDTIRYSYLLKNYLALKSMDSQYSPENNYIRRKFEGEMGYPIDKIRSLFIELITSDEVKQTAQLVQKRIGRDLKPWDIWYDGFKARNLIDENLLTQKTKELYPEASDFKKDLPRILHELGFENSRAEWLASQVEVDDSRGAGHAWGAQMKSDKARLRTHIKDDGMDYKGYNIAVHEFGHNIEQTISLHDSPFYLMNGVPNTAFSEATAFVFQSRDMELLGMGNMGGEEFESFKALDNLWVNFEMMGVSLVDMAVWEWLYTQEEVDAEMLKGKTLEIAAEIWNKYYFPIFGEKNSTILAIYSHMIDYPLYLSSYPVGYLAQFQLEEYMSDKNLATEMQRILSLGRFTPDIWLQKAIGDTLSTQPLLKSSKKALSSISSNS